MSAFKVLLFVAVAVATVMAEDNERPKRNNEHYGPGHGAYPYNSAYASGAYPYVAGAYPYAAGAYPHAAAAYPYAAGAYPYSASAYPYSASYSSYPSSGYNAYSAYPAARAYY